MPINNIKVGTNFDPELIKGIAELNKLSETNKVVEVYGSLKMHAKYAARPDFRLPDASIQDLKEYVALCHENDIEFNYTLNSPLATPKNKLHRLKEVLEIVKELERCGVDRITVADMLLLDFIHDKTSMSIEVSTIAHVDTVSQASLIRSKYGVDKICNNLLKNRSFAFLRKMAEIPGLTVELLVNEFCASGDNITTTHCMVRDNCYDCHAVTKTLDQAREHRLWPMSECITARNSNRGAWLKTNFVLPQHFHHYNKVGINHWKVTGRTGTTEYILATLKPYILGRYKGNLPALWKPLQTIYSNQNELDMKYRENIPCDTEIMDNFLDPWLFPDPVRCEEELCGVSCRYCDLIYKELQNS